METWRAIADYEGKYEISDLGRVRSLDRLVWNNLSEAFIPWRGRILRTKSKASGHMAVSLSSDGKLRDHYIHRLVLEAFVSPCPEGMEALHFDDNPANNVLENLKWGTRTQNIADRIRNGRRCNKKRTHCKNGHELLPSTVKTRSDGGRSCIICLRTYQREWKRRKKATSAPT